MQGVHGRSSHYNMRRCCIKGGIWEMEHWAWTLIASRWQDTWVHGRFEHEEGGVPTPPLPGFGPRARILAGSDLSVLSRNAVLLLTASDRPKTSSELGLACIALTSSRCRTDPRLRRRESG